MELLLHTPRLVLRAAIALSLASLSLASPASAQPPVDQTRAEVMPEFARAADSRFGQQLAFDGTTIAVGSKDRIDVYRWDGSAAVYEATLDPGPEARVDYGLAGLDVLGDLLLAADPASDDHRGSLYVFERAGDGTWTRTSRDVGPCCDPGGVFGASIEIEGPRVAIGAPYYGGGFGSAVLLRADSAGDFAYVAGRYSRWVPTVGHLAGFDVGLRGDLVLIGNLGSGTGMTDSGGAYLLRDTGTALVEVLHFENPTPGNGDQFGIETEIDDTSLYVAARYDDEGGFDAGAIHVFDHDGALQQSLIGPGDYARMGGSFDVDGDWMVAGCPAFILPGNPDGESPHLGSVRFYRRGADGRWVDRGSVSMPGGQLGTEFGVSIQLVGHVVVVGAPTASVSGGTGQVFTIVLTEPDGQPCSADDECTNGVCADGVCCDRACDGSCEACAASLTGGADGTCAPVTDHTDPDADCAGACPGTCMAGVCAIAECDAGTPDGGSSSDASIDDAGARDGGARSDAGAMADAGQGDGGTGVPRLPLSCTCRAYAPRSGHGALAMVLAMVLAILARRRR